MPILAILGALALIFIFWKTGMFTGVPGGMDPGAVKNWQQSYASYNGRLLKQFDTRGARGFHFNAVVESGEVHCAVYDEKGNVIYAGHNVDEVHTDIDFKRPNKSAIVVFDVEKFKGSVDISLKYPEEEKPAGEIPNAGDDGEAADAAAEETKE